MGGGLRPAAALGTARERRRAEERGKGAESVGGIGLRRWAAGCALWRGRAGNGGGTGDGDGARGAARECGRAEERGKGAESVGGIGLRRWAAG